MQHSGLLSAFGRAALGKRGKGDVESFRSQLNENLVTLRGDLLSDEYRPLTMRYFTIRDPKLRLIHAPAFRDRVLHHALMSHMGPVLDSTLIDDSFACRLGKGSHAAVRRAAYFTSRAKWLMHADVSNYFGSIQHGALKLLIRRKFSDHRLLKLVNVIIDNHGSGKGLPIGALTSQYFANVYLGTVDRFVSTHPLVNGYVRYMDDMVWWCQSRQHCEEVLSEVDSVLEPLDLVLKSSTVAKPSRDGFRFCGYRILPGRVLLSRRGRRSIRSRLAEAEAAFSRETITERELQRMVDSILACARHADGQIWKRRMVSIND